MCRERRPEQFFPKPERPLGTGEVASSRYSVNLHGPSSKWRGYCREIQTLCPFLTLFASNAEHSAVAPPNAQGDGGHLGEQVGRMYGIGPIVRGIYDQGDLGRTRAWFHLKPHARNSLIASSNSKELNMVDSIANTWFLSLYLEQFSDKVSLS